MIGYFRILQAPCFIQLFHELMPTTTMVLPLYSEITMIWILLNQRELKVLEWILSYIQLFEFISVGSQPRHSKHKLISPCYRMTRIINYWFYTSKSTSQFLYLNAMTYVEWSFKQSIPVTDMLFFWELFIVFLNKLQIPLCSRSILSSERHQEL